MDDGISLAHFVRGVILLGGTVVLQALSQSGLARVSTALPMRHVSHRSPLWLAYVVACVLVLMLGHIMQVLLWAVVYFHMGELGSFANCIYFSLASFTTVGASELVLSPAHRIAGALEAAAGMLMFGWSTALLVQVVQRSEGR
ncbi:MAG: two pore domain potassium channel family protein [Alphaproteobacteria bacterium]|nr:two pore domain potassium channel family protein [Alphaproteobacteria bacterium]